MPSPRSHGIPGAGGGEQPSCKGNSQPSKGARQLSAQLARALVGGGLGLDLESALQECSQGKVKVSP